jgi:carbon monoxide dehydrogenase subunit G
MNHIKVETRIEAPVEHVWAFLCDTSHWADWQPGYESYDFTGPYDQVGTTYVGKTRLMGVEMKLTYTIVEVKPLRLIHERTEGPQDNYYRLEPEGDATHLTIECDYELPGRIPGFLKDLVSKSWVERHMRHLLADFKAFAELKVPVPA